MYKVNYTIFNPLHSGNPQTSTFANSEDPVSYAGPYIVWQELST